MKNHFLHVWRKGAAVCGVVLVSFLLINCSSKDLEFIDPYEFVNTDFDQVGDLPVVGDEEIEFEEPNTGSVANSAQTQSIITTVMGASESEGVPAETIAILEEAGEFVDDMPVAVYEAAQSLTADDVSAILDIDQALDSDLEALRDQLDEMPAEVAALLPTLEFDVAVETVGMDAGNSLRSPEFNTPEFTITAQTLNGPCADAARLSYNFTMEDLQAQRDANLLTINNNYTRRIEEADARYDARIELHEENYIENVAQIEAVILELLDAATHAESFGNISLAEDLRVLALIYAVEARVTLIEWNALVLELLEDTTVEEKAVVEARRDARIAEVEANFNTVKAEADAILATALNACHNQGSGN